MMHIFNIRLNFAHNSSSSHSLLLLGNDEAVEQDDGIQQDGYHWETFTLSSTESKAHYFWTQVKLAMKAINAEPYFKILFGLSEEEIEKLDAAGIDHQSVWSFPTHWDGSSVHVEFIKDFFNYVVNQKNLVILGGNDNGGDHPLQKSDPDFNFSIDHYGLGRFVAVKDDLNESWTLFNRSNGHRVRLSFKESQPFKKLVHSWDDVAHVNSNLPSSVPALVDIKITNYCPFGCKYCYQGSTPTGEHASLENISKIATELGQKNVFEVALGGGETTLHPDFLNVLKLFNDQKIVVNFTTRNKAWLNKKEAKEILNLVGGVAFSIDTVEDLEEIFNLFKDKNESQKNITFQVVPGALDEIEVRKIIDRHVSQMSDWGPRFGLTFLGYKETGFGQDFLTNENSSLKIAQEKELSALKYAMDQVNQKEKLKRQLPIHIDTTMAKSAKEWLSSHKIPSSVFHFVEGTSSMYIDATSMKMGTSSYAPESMTDFGDDWVEVFQNNGIQSFKSEFKKIKTSMSP